MASTQKFGITYPFSSDNLEEIYLDLNNTYEDKIKSEVLHVLFTPKGQRLRNPDFGTDLIKFLFSQNDASTISDLVASLKKDIGKYVPNVSFDNIDILQGPDDNSRIIAIKYSVTKGNKKESTSVAIKI